MFYNFIVNMLYLFYKYFYNLKIVKFKKE